MSSIKTTQIDGDVSIGRNTAIGGQATISGSATIGHNLKVSGWLEAPNIKGIVKGVFLSEASLKKAYPRPIDGWLAGVGNSTPFDAYIGCDGEWLPTSGRLDIGADTSHAEEVSGMRDDIDEFGKEVETMSHAVDNHTTQLTSHHERLDAIESEMATKADKTSVQTLEENLQAANTKIAANKTSINNAQEEIISLWHARDDLKEDLDVLESEVATKADKTSVHTIDKNLQDAKAELNASKADLSYAQGAVRVLPFHGFVQGVKIEEQGVSSYDKVVFDTDRNLFLVSANVSFNTKYYMSFVGSDEYNKDLKARTDRIYLDESAGLLYISVGEKLLPFSMSEGERTKLVGYPSQFILDLGTMSSQDAGEAKAASSEVAGNRNISFIRFQVNGVSALKTTLILQWANGINETAQIKFVDKAEWRRNVTGATGVVGANTSVTQWERTAPHYLGYDAANRKIQLKDYTQAVSREVQLPLVSASSAGLFSPSMLSALEFLNQKVAGYADNFEDNSIADSGNISGDAHAGLMSSQDKAKLENYPTYPQDIVEVTEQQNGLMMSADKVKLDAYPSTPLEIPVATSSSSGLLSSTELMKIQVASSAVLSHNTKLNTHTEQIAALETSNTDQEQRIQSLEAIHAPSDMVEFTIQNDKAQRNVLFYKIEWIDDLEIDGKPINTEGLSGKFYRALSVGEHKVRFRVSEENRTQRGLLGWADDESAGYLSNVTRIVIPEGWTEIAANCFEARSKLEEVVLPSTLSIVGSAAFQNLANLKRIVLPKGVTEVRWQAFNNCPQLEYICMGGGTGLEIAYSSMKDCPLLSCVEILDCAVRFTGTTSPWQNCPQLSSLIFHMTTSVDFEPGLPFGTIGSGVSDTKRLFRPSGITFYDESYWQTQLCTTLGFVKTDI